MHTLSFAPLSSPQARVLILGSLPGQASVRLGQYYGHPQNKFWPIMEQLFGFDATLAYAQRTQNLLRHQVALWDVCAAAHRPGSLDSAIQPGSIAPNDIAGFLKSHPAVRLIAFNGSAAAALFRRHVLPGLPDLPGLAYASLPSTSPANAGVPYAEKLRRWRLVLTTHLTGPGS